MEITENLTVQEEDKEEILTMPCIPLRGLLVYPRTVLHFDVGREKSIRALEAAMNKDKILFVSSQKDENILIPTPDDYYKVGTVVKIKQMLKIQGDSVRVLVEGMYRASIKEITAEEPYISASVDRLESINMPEDSIEARAMTRVVLNSFNEYAQLATGVRTDIYDLSVIIDDPDALADSIAIQLDIDISKKQKILETLDVRERLTILNGIIFEENQILRLEKKLNEEVEENVKQNQKEYYLREQMKVIQNELGFGEDAVSEAKEWLDKLDELKLDPKTDEKVRKEINKFTKMVPSSAESGVIRNYVETILSLPWNKSSKTNSDIKKAEKVLDEDHYGLEKVKERILEYLAVIHLSKGIKGPIICLVGPPGVGKTSIARSIARATGREFVRMSLGGVRDEAEIRGHRRTYIGAIPGRVISAIKDAGANNPVFLFDEVDKIGSDFKGDPASALLEVLDPEQNKEFTDHFLEIPFDLSNVMFITTANTTETIPRPLLDRMEVIDVSGYTEEEKVKIAQKYLVPKQMKAHGLKKKNFAISEKALRDLINFYTRESGVRNLEREIGSLCRKVARKIVAKKAQSYRITPASLENYLGKHRFRYDVVENEREIGVTTGMAWTQVGGDTLFIEAALVPGAGKIELTGQLGDVMQESARTAITYIRSIADEYGIEEDFYKKYDLHVHVPEGAVPKDGPSAGVTMFTSVMSVLLNKPVRKDVAMTGEITLRGKVLPVGGIKEKVLAAHRAGIRTILLPAENKADIDDIPQSVRKQLKFVLLEKADETLKYVLEESSGL
ncbi:MAG: endopeptidase La [Candidatus Fimisoma sp.]|jgi:ATP-dependent Lon protease|nr:endopeptidase La [Bacillota bacterium]MDD7284369.1 endopeptidase La [Bacillota bacterium]MDY4747735.1 endopeptidase La [Candidatus Fimisoma sp.]